MAHDNQRPRLQLAPRGVRPLRPERSQGPTDRSLWRLAQKGKRANRARNARNEIDSQVYFKSPQPIQNQWSAILKSTVL